MMRSSSIIAARNALSKSNTMRSLSSSSSSITMKRSILSSSSSSIVPSSSVPLIFRSPSASGSILPRHFATARRPRPAPAAAAAVERAPSTGVAHTSRKLLLDFFGHSRRNVQVFFVAVTGIMIGILAWKYREEPTSHDLDIIGQTIVECDQNVLRWMASKRPDDADAIASVPATTDAKAVVVDASAASKASSAGVDASTEGTTNTASRTVLTADAIVPIADAIATATAASSSPAVAASATSATAPDAYAALGAALTVACPFPSPPVVAPAFTFPSSSPSSPPLSFPSDSTIDGTDIHDMDGAVYVKLPPCARGGTGGEMHIRGKRKKATTMMLMKGTGMKEEDRFDATKATTTAAASTSVAPTSVAPTTTAAATASDAKSVVAAPTPVKVDPFAPVAAPASLAKSSSPSSTAAAEKDVEWEMTYLALTFPEVNESFVYDFNRRVFTHQVGSLPAAGVRDPSVAAGAPNSTIIDVSDTVVPVRAKPRFSLESFTPANPFTTFRWYHPLMFGGIGILTALARGRWLNRDNYTLLRQFKSICNNHPDIRAATSTVGNNSSLMFKRTSLTHPKMTIAKAGNYQQEHSVANATMDDKTQMIQSFQISGNNTEASGRVVVVIVNVTSMKVMDNNRVRWKTISSTMQRLGKRGEQRIVMPMFADQKK